MVPEAELHQDTPIQATEEDLRDRAVLQDQQEVSHPRVALLQVIHSHPQAAHVQGVVATAEVAEEVHVREAAVAAAAAAVVTPAEVAEEEEGNSSYYPLLKILQP